METHNKDKIKVLLEEKSLLEDEMIAIAGLARKYQTESKHFKEELEKLESSYHSICTQNSLLESDLIRLNTQLQDSESENSLLESKLIKLNTKLQDSESENSLLESELIRLNSQLQDSESENNELRLKLINLTKNLETSNSSEKFQLNDELSIKNLYLEKEVSRLSDLIKQLNEECEELKGLCSEKTEEISALRELVDKDRKTNAIKELSYIILSKDHADSPVKTKYNHMITDVLENKIKSLEQETQEYLSKYRNILFKYIECLKEYRENSVKWMMTAQVEGQEEMVKSKLNYLDIEIEFSEFELERLSCEEISYYTSFGESPMVEEGRKSKGSQISIHYLLIQAAMIESLISRNGS